MIDGADFDLNSLEPVKLSEFDCGMRGAFYASEEHYLMGDW